MGIHNLHVLLKNQKGSEEMYKEYPFFYIKGCKIGIDASIFIYKYMACFGKPGWINGFIHLYCSLKENGATFVLILDGEAPIEKQKEKEKRDGVKQKLKDKLNALNVLYDSMEGKQILLKKEQIQEGTPESIIYRLYYNQLYVGEKDSEKISVSKTFLKSEIDKVSKQCIEITQDDTNLLKNLTMHMGIPVIQAPGEAEAYGAYMCVHGFLDAVMTEDTDVLAYGCPMLICKISMSKKVFSIIKLEMVLETLNITFEQFRDLAILLGNDYNSNIKGIGPSGAIKLIEKYGTIDSIDAKKVDISSIPYKRSRELFSVPSMDEVCDYLLFELNIEPFDIQLGDLHPELDSFLYDSGLEGYIGYINQRWEI